jgi:hypothetical protein
MAMKLSGKRAINKNCKVNVMLGYQYPKLSLDKAPVGIIAGLALTKHLS